MEFQLEITIKKAYNNTMKLPVNYENLTWQERKTVREEYIRIQNGNCHFCGTPLTGEPAQPTRDKNINLRLFPDNFLKNPIHLHHNHNTGMTIGAVHARCNAVLWQYFGE